MDWYDQTLPFLEGVGKSQVSTYVDNQVAIVKSCDEESEVQLRYPTGSDVEWHVAYIFRLLRFSPVRYQRAKVKFIVIFSRF